MKKLSSFIVLLGFLSLMLFQSTLAFGATTKTVTGRKTFYSLAGIAVAKHYGTTYWTYNGGRLYSSPAGKYNDWFTAPLNYVNGQSRSWDWYMPGYGGTGRSNLQVKFTFGVPTPWGPIGSHYTSRILTWFNGSGNYQFYYR